MTLVKFSKEQVSFMKHGSAILVHGETWHHVPFWYKETDQENVFEEVSMEDLPNYLKEAIERFRSGDGIFTANKPK